MKWCLRTLGSALVLLAIACCSTAQTPMMDVSRLAQIPAVSGYEQTLIEEYEVRFTPPHEFQSRFTIRSDDDLIACLLREHLAKP